MTDLLDTLIPLTVVGIFVAVVGMAIAGGAGIAMPRDDSTYSGYVVDVEKDSGFLFRTTEVHMKTHPRSSNSETFCLRNNENIDVFTEALTERQKVNVQYDRPLFVWRGECESGLSIARDASLTNETVSG